MVPKRRGSGAAVEGETREAGGMSHLAQSDWNADFYHLVSEPQVAWGRRVLERLELRGEEDVSDVGCGSGRLTAILADRLPAGRLVGIDRSPAMLRKALEHLPGRGIRLVCADAAALPFVRAFDVVFSTATFHWVLDHDALFLSLRQALKPGGLLHAQCGGGSNLARLRTRAARLAGESNFTQYFGSHWKEPWHYADAEQTLRRLRRAGFADADAWLEPAPVRFEDPVSYRTFVEHVCLRPYLARLPANLQNRLSDTLVNLALADDPPLTLDYVRLNITARRPR